MRIALVDPYLGDSHLQWANGLKRHSKHEVQIYGLPGKHWKWRMHGGTIQMAQEIILQEKPDLFLVTDMLDLATFRSLLPADWRAIPIYLYFHENQLSYPFSPQDSDLREKRDNHYAFINLSSALAADRIFFNSAYHQEVFFESIPDFIGQFPKPVLKLSYNQLRAKSAVLHLGCELNQLRKQEELVKEIQPFNRAVIVWNHRWEYDKNPEQFFQALFQLQERGIDFKLVVLGQAFNKSPAIFKEARKRLSEKIVHWGYCDCKDDYASWLWQSDILPVTSNQDFFGSSVVEAMACNVVPLLPKRLAFPEHIPSSLMSSFFYDDHMDFVNRLQRLIMNVKVIRNQEVSKHVMHYDWSQIIGKYDGFFEPE